MKRILIACIGTEVGGVEKSLIEFLDYLITLDCDIDLIHWKKPGPLYPFIPPKINILPRLSPMGMSDIKKIGNAIKICKELIWYLTFRVFKYVHKPWKCFKGLAKHYDMAISYCHNGYSPYYVIDKVNADRKFLWYHHGLYERNGVVKKTDEEYYSKYDKVVTVSETNVTMLANTFPVLKDKVCCIRNLFNEDNIRTKAKEEISDVWGTGIKLCTVSRVSSEKGQLFALDVAKRLKDKGLEFSWMFVGDGPDYDDCLEKVKAEGLNECVFVGLKSNPYPYMAQADLYVQSSYVEADPIAIREAKVLGKKIVSSDILALCEALDNGRYGKLCPLDAEEFANGILEVIEDVKRGDNINTYKDGDSDNDIICKEIKNLLFEE